MLRVITIVVQRVLPRNDHGQENPVSHRDVNALDSYRSHSGNPGTFHDGVST